MKTETIMRYRKKPVVVEAFQLLPHSLFPDWAMWKVKVSYQDDHWIEAEIKTLEGTMTAKLGDYIIKGVQSEIYPCKPDIFETTYEPVTNDME